MVEVDPDDRARSEDEALARFKREIYQKVFGVIFSDCLERSHTGTATMCSDGVLRVLHPGIFVLALDGLEAWYFCACRAGHANHPCPQCLVHKDDLHLLTKRNTFRYSEDMKDIVMSARAKRTKQDKEDLLQRHGLHDFEV
jgi:hypothetical protein